MTGKDHVSFAVYSVSLVVAGRYIPNIPLTYSALGGVFIGSLLPDVDHEKAVLGRFSPIPFIHKILKKLKVHILKHGGITHTILVNLLIVGLAYWHKSDFMYGVAFGFATHLYADDATGNKLPMLWFPFRIKGK
jgi:membrane-bound metal-dependent hydrolase YbcI (DUF457 family)